MASVIVVRILPATPTDPYKFTSYLTNLSLTAYDRTVSNTSPSVATGQFDVTLGTAQGLFLPPLDASQNAIAFPPLAVNASGTAYVDSIFQHYDATKLPSATPFSVGTALIVVNEPSNYAEYADATQYDIRIAVFQTDSSGTHQVSVPLTIEYNVINVQQVPVGGLNTPNLTNWATLQSSLLTPTTVYCWIPPPLITSSASNPIGPPVAGAVGAVNLGDPTTPPDFYDLVAAVDKVLTMDPSPGAASLETQTGPLTSAQCNEIASELIYERYTDPPPDPSSTAMFPAGTTTPPPVPPPSIEVFYTSTQNQQPISALQGMTYDQLRQSWEISWKAYHATRDANATRLAQYIFAASAAVYAEVQTINATTAIINVPVDPALHPTTSDPLQTFIQGSPAGASIRPYFYVPAPYFYAIGVKLSMNLSAQDRYKAATITPLSNLTTELQTAADNGLIHFTVAPGVPPYVAPFTTPFSTTPFPGTSPPVTPPGITLDQAARRISALSAQFLTNPFTTISIPLTSPHSPEFRLILDWLTNTTAVDAFDATFWPPHISFPAVPPNPNWYYKLLLDIIAGGNNPSALVDSFITTLGIHDAASLLAVTDDQWYNFLYTFITANPTLLPAYLSPGTLPGGAGRQASAFLSFLRKIFQPKPSVRTQIVPVGTTIAAATPASEILQQFLSQYGTTFSFASLNAAADNNALALAFPGDLITQDWVRNAITVISNLLGIVTVAGVSQNYQYSYMEALYARGFTSMNSILELTNPQFVASMIGTVAYQDAATIWTLVAASVSSTGPTPPPAPGSGFQPVNPGSLINCVPPLHLSPLGPCEYLFEMLNTPMAGSTLLNLISARRGALGTLAITKADLEVQLPLFDLVLESLEFMAAVTAAPGAIYQTTTTGIMGAKAGEDAMCEVEDLLSATPQHSSPSLTIAQHAVYGTLENVFTSPELPYSQPLDTNRTYLHRLCTTRFDIMRRFRKDITEYCLLEIPNMSLAPPDFNKTLWRLPVDFPIALEYLQISSAEYDTFYNGSFLLSQTSTLYGFLPSDPQWPNVLQLGIFLHSTGLSYCEFLELWESKLIPFSRAGPNHHFPHCPPCCLDDVVIVLPGSGPTTPILAQLIFFIRLWRKLHHECHFKSITFSILADICEVLGLFLPSGTANPDFVRQLASLLMLVHTFDLPWGHTKSHTIGVTRTRILGLWPGSSGAPTDWAIDALLRHLGTFSQRHFDCCEREPSFIKVLRDNLVQLSHLLGFSNANPWYANPTSTIRFAEVLAKLYASSFSVGDIIFLFTNRRHLDGEDPFPLTERVESLDMPLNWPDDDPHGIWELREKLLKFELREEDLEDWDWDRIVRTIQELGKRNITAISAFGEHFFPETLESQGHPVSQAARRWTYALNTTQTTPTLWHSEPRHPFHYALGPIEAPPPGPPPTHPVHSGNLWVELPLRDDDVSRKLRDCRQLRDVEILAVQDLYFAPRAMAAPFALIFSNFNVDINFMIQEADEKERFRFFRRQFVLFYKRCRIIAEHLAHHVHGICESGHADGCCDCEKPDSEIAWRVLQSLIADENFTADSWENPSGTAPPASSFEWDPHFSGNAFAALLGLVGTGLQGKYEVGNVPTWTEMRGGIKAFGREEDEWSTPIPTVIPALNDPIPAPPGGLQLFKNGFILRDKHGEAVDGAQPFSVCWKGILLVEHAGHYKFKACHPKEECRSDCEHEFGQKWLVTLERGQKHFPVLNHCAHGPPAPPCESHPICLSRGAYTITIEVHQDLPGKDHRDHLKHFRSGFELKYEGPDTEHCMKVVPFHRLIQNWKIRERARDPDAPLAGPAVISPTANAFLQLQYVSTLRDIRRTYQRAFKATLFATRFCLSARRHEADWQSELGFMLDHPHRFRGTSYALPASGPATSSHVDFNFNFFPVRDRYAPPGTGTDARAHPSVPRQAALFDWWERVFDYTLLRYRVRERSCKRAWLLFEEAVQQEHLNQPASLDQRTEQLLRLLGVELDDTSLLITYFHQPLLKHLTPRDLVDERWPIRVWHAFQYIEQIEKAFFAEHLSKAKPYLWAASDPNEVIDGESGNHNLVTLVRKDLLDSKDVPQDIKGLRDINNGLRCRARKAILAYLCGMSRVSLSPLGLTTFAVAPQDLSDLLLQDVEVGLEEKSSRIEDAIHSTQMFVQRARIGLEPGWTHHLSELWECRFGTFGIWSAFQRRHVYHENWLYWDEMQKLKKFESVKYLTKQLEAGEISIVERGHPLWWGGGITAPQDSLTQSQELVTLQLQHDSLPEGLSLMGQPMRDGRQTLLSPLSTDLNPTVGTPPIRPQIKQQESSSVTETMVTDSMAASSSSGFGNAEIVIVEDVKAAAVPTVAPEILSGLAALNEIPLWIQSAIRLGTQFIRVAAAKQGPGIPYTGKLNPKDSCCEQCGKIHDPCVDEYYFWLEYAHIYRVDDVGGQTSTTKSSLYPHYVQDATIDTLSGGSGPTDPDSDWSVPSQLPALLEWPSQPIVHLYWTRVHMGTLDPPRRSDEGILVNLPQPPPPPPVPRPSLGFDGRIEDAIYFPVSNPGNAATPNPGIFKYDINSDRTWIIQTLPTMPSPPFGSPPLDPYPWFIHFTPGEPLFPISGFEVALSIAGSYKAKCAWEKALKWSRVAFDPLTRDNTWALCKKKKQEPTPPQQRHHHHEKHVTTAADLDSSSETTEIAQETPAVTPGENHGKDLGHHGTPIHPPIIVRDPPCCPCGPTKGQFAKARAALMSFLKILLEWADSLMCRNSMEHFQQALVIYDFMHRVLGPTPITVHAHDVFQPAMTLATFAASPPPLNPELMLFYEEVADRRRLIHDSVNRRRLKTGKKHHEPSPWFSHRRFDIGDEQAGCEDAIQCFSCCQPYRFSVLHQKALIWVNVVKNLGTSLLSAYEKADNELLSTLRETQQRQILDLGLEINKNQWRAADWDCQALYQSMNSALTNLTYYNGLIAGGNNSGEQGYVNSTQMSMTSRASAEVSDGVAQASAPEPDPYVGAAGFAGTPVSVMTTPGGVKIADMFTSAARILNGVAEYSNTQAGLELTQGGWDRRLAEWKHQVDMITIEIQQVKRQTLAAERRRHVALRELNNHERGMEHAAEVLDFLRDKFTKQELYLFLQEETSGLYKQSYNLAMKAARDAQQAFWYERGDTAQDFLREAHWESLQEGLMAGERLELALLAMDQKYMDLNCREYELTKTFSLRLHFPLAFLALKTVGSCEFEIPEWMYDLDFPCHYMRRIKNISISVPCVAGPYTGLHCRAQLLKSAIRYKPLLPGPEACCCPPKLKGCCEHDPFLIQRYSATEAIAISEPVDDDGLFELNFRDERYLPFEFSGAVSKWKLDMPRENNAFDYDSLTDVVIKLNYTAREGGPELGRLKNSQIKDRVPGNGLRYFDVRHEFQDSWRVFGGWDKRQFSCGHRRERETCCEGKEKKERCRDCRKEGKEEDCPARDFELRLTRNMFPFLTCNRLVLIKRIHIFVETDEHCGDHIKLKYFPEPRGKRKCCEEEKCKDVILRLGPKCCGSNDRCADGEHEKGWTKGCCNEGKRCCCATVFHGVVDVCIGPLLEGRRERDEGSGKLKLPCELRGVRECWLVCEYVGLEREERGGLCCGSEKNGFKKLGLC